MYGKVYLEYLFPDFGKYDEVNKKCFVGEGVYFFKVK